MNRIYTATLSLLLFVVAAHAQNIGIGTTQPDASAALDISSSNKGLLIPRIDLSIAAPAAPATGLMVFNTNTAYIGGTGLYINMGTSAVPQWTQLVPSTSGGFVRNQTSQQANANFNISGAGIIGNTLKVGVAAQRPLIVQSSDQLRTSLQLSNTSNAQANWDLVALGSLSSSPGGFALRNSSNGTIVLNATQNGSVAINKSGVPTAALDVNGDIKASGNFLMDVLYIRRDFSLSANTRLSWSIPCPAGYQVISGGGGHRDDNSAANDIKLSYSGPDPDAPTAKWRVLMNNTGSRSRAIIVYCNCAKVK